MQQALKQSVAQKRLAKAVYKGGSDAAAPRWGGAAAPKGPARLCVAILHSGINDRNSMVRFSSTAVTSQDLGNEIQLWQSMM